MHHLARIRAPRLAIIALPLKLMGCDASPSRVVALEGVDLPSEFKVR